jgi:hypothetical protein
MNTENNIRIITTFRVPDEIVEHLFKDIPFDSDDKVYALPKNFLKTVKDEQTTYQIYINYDSFDYLEHSNDSLCRVIEDSDAKHIVVIVILELEGLKEFSRFLTEDFPWKITRYHYVAPESVILRPETCYLYEKSIGLTDDEPKAIGIGDSRIQKVVDIDFVKRKRAIFVSKKD